MCHLHRAFRRQLAHERVLVRSRLPHIVLAALDTHVQDVSVVSSADQREKHGKALDIRRVVVTFFSNLFLLIVAFFTSHQRL